jgi:hypothetical protein
VLVVFTTPAAARLSVAPEATNQRVLHASPSDSRAQLVTGNAGRCGEVGFPAAVQVSESGDTSDSDGNVSGTAVPNAGATQPGKGEELNVTVTNPNAIVDAVVVKGGPAHNVYSSAAVLPSTLPAPQHYIAPLNGGGNVPDIGHWFLCYHLATPPPAGSLTVENTDVDPPDLPAAPLPTGETAVVDCNDADPAHQNVPVTFNEGGGESGAPTLTNIPAGTICTVTELNTTSLPPGSTVSYEPPVANTVGVTITADAPTIVDIVDDFTAVPLLKGSVQLANVLIAPPLGVSTPSSFAAHVSCDDGTETDVNLPGAGGTGTPIVSADAEASCEVEEDTSALPPGWLVTYAVGAIAPSSTSPTAASSTPPILLVVGEQTITVTITNDPTAVPAVTTTPPTTAPAAEAPTMPGTLPPTGGDATGPVIIAVLLVSAGLAILCLTRRPARAQRG